MFNLNPNLKPPAMQELEDFLGKYIKGQPKAIEVLAKAYAFFKTGVKKFSERDEKRPIGVFLFLGPSRTGKTQISRVLAQKFHGTQKAVTMIDCVNFQERHEVAKLVGAPPGYIGHGDKLLLSKENLYSKIPGHQVKPLAGEPKNDKKEKEKEENQLNNESLDDAMYAFSLILRELDLINQTLKNIDRQFSHLRHIALSQIQRKERKENLIQRRKVLYLRRDILHASYFEMAIAMMENHEVIPVPSQQTPKKVKVEEPKAIPKSAPTKEAPEEEPIIIIIFDEIEKANASVHQFLLQLMEEGRAVLGNGEEVNLSRAFIILTSNIGSKLIGKATKGIAKIGFSSGDAQTNLEKFVKAELTKFFSQEFLNRLDGIVTFNILSPQDFQDILELEVEELSFSLAKLSLKFTVDQSVKDFILKEAAKNPEEQVKSLQDCLKKYLVAPIGNLLATGQLTEKKKLSAVFDSNKKQVIFKT